MKKKWLWGIGIFLGISFMISLDLYKSHKEEQPPIPIIIVGDVEATVTLGMFQWNDKLMNDKEKDEILQNTRTTSINPLEHLSIRFPGEQPTSITVSFWDEKYQMDMPLFQGKHEKNKLIRIPNDPGPLTLTIQGKWEGKKQATFYVPLERTQVVSYQSLLSDDDQSFSFFYVYDEMGFYDPFAGTPIGTPSISISKWTGTDDLQSVQKNYPELNITAAPTYLLFDDEKVVIQTNDDKELLQFFEKKFQPLTETLGGIVFEIDREKKILDLSWRKFYYEKIEELKIGQEIQAKVTFNHLTDPFQTEVHSMEIISDPPEELLQEKWFSKKPNQYNLVAVGDEHFFAQMNDLVREEILSRINKVYFEPVSGGWHFIGQGFVLFDDQGAVYITFYFKNLLEYLKSHE
ncbi:hypothetical protein [Robertmurraya andreesenii]|uniref:Uncharacterized protein n=1 Tax=Anoxybacillus andreesenii TaxID=1325932 RepID=A0ABT9V1J6_9BACL|nr:hypothetical protein [Robertmurraya andreesenii]MDQ0154823.1 hypothetical protein [Robertmurraya andreesenii]